ncbi:hypothetical protein IWX49DRAFT_179656 [Phyllosticta citricarpa]|uniref:Zn(2)-C6 fungal-type domain-containing protein n=2 Tax=Phyllosticta TaxID=121621 RepID=A0ABR1M5B7_9PEZI
MIEKMAQTDTGAISPQLRSSCDSCNSAKVKCTKSRPQCERCVARGTECVYSVSLRSVKRKRGLGKQHSRSPSNALNTPASIILDDFVDFDPSAADMGLPPPCLEDWNVSFDMPLFNSPDLTPVSTMSACSFASPESPSATSTCQCQQLITAKLAQLTVKDQETASLPFDAFLTNSKAVMDVCISAINCRAANHKEDLQLALVLSALLLHLVGMYESKLAASSRPHHYGAAAPVKLSFGSYQFDHQDAQIMEANLIHLELSKIRGMVESFDQRFSSPTRSSPDLKDDADPVAPLIAHVQRRLQRNFDAVRSCVASLDTVGQ